MQYNEGEVSSEHTCCRSSAVREVFFFDRGGLVVAAVLAGFEAGVGVGFATLNMNIGCDERDESVLRCCLSLAFSLGCLNSVKWFGFFL
jgi:hypothetical protein